VWDLAVRLEGSSVRLEPLRPDHEDGLAEAARSNETFAWWPLDLSESREAVRQFVALCLEAARDGERQHYATVDARTGELIGSTSYCLIQPEHRVLEIGWTFLTPSRWRSGANTEAKLLMLRHAFDVCGCQRVQIVTDANNEQSRAAILSLGAQFEGIHRDDRIVPRDGRRRSSAFYSIIEAEWPGVEGGLVGRLKGKVGG